MVYNKRAGENLPSIKRKEVFRVFISDFIAAVMASVVAYYVCKWLDGDE